jgi:hypothetical protein
VEGVGIGPFAQGGLDEALGLAVGARRVGSGSLVRQSARLQGAGEELAAVSGAVVSHDALDDDAMGGEPRQRVLEEADGAPLFLVGHQRGVGEAGGVIDGDVEIVAREKCQTPRNAVAFWDLQVFAFARLLSARGEKLANPLFR